jgi:hypothetical protein
MHGSNHLVATKPVVIRNKNDIAYYTESNFVIINKLLKQQISTSLPAVMLHNEWLTQLNRSVFSYTCF